MKVKLTFRIGRNSINLSELSNEDRFKLRHGIPIQIKKKKRKAPKYIYRIFKEWNEKEDSVKEA